MKKIITLSIMLITVSQIHAQWWGSSIKGNGQVKKITRSVVNYDALSVAGFFEVTLVAGTEGTLDLEGESNLLQYIKTEVKEGVLKIRVENNKTLKTSMGKDIRIRVPFDTLEKVTLSGSGEIIGKDIIRAQDFNVNVTGSGYVTIDVEASNTKSSVSGSGDLVLKGSSSKHQSSVTGSGDIDASRFNAADVNAKVTGSGDIKIYCSRFLKARVTGSGDIIYLGQPDEQDTKVSGSGDITQS